MTLVGRSRRLVGTPSRDRDRGGQFAPVEAGHNPKRSRVGGDLEKAGQPGAFVLRAVQVAIDPVAFLDNPDKGVVEERVDHSPTPKRDRAELRLSANADEAQGTCDPGRTTGQQGRRDHIRQQIPEATCVGEWVDPNSRVTAFRIVEGADGQNVAFRINELDQRHPDSLGPCCALEDPINEARCRKECFYRGRSHRLPRSGRPSGAPRCAGWR